MNVIHTQSMKARQSAFVVAQKAASLEIQQGTSPLNIKVVVVQKDQVVKRKAFTFTWEPQWPNGKMGPGVGGSSVWCLKFGRGFFDAAGSRKGTRNAQEQSSATRAINHKAKTGMGLRGFSWPINFISQFIHSHRNCACIGEGHSLSTTAHRRLLSIYAIGWR